MDLMTVCLLTEMANVLSFQTYSPDGMPQCGRAKCRHARSRTRHMIDWFSGLYEVTDLRTQEILEPRRDVYWPYVARVASAIITYKTKAHKEKLGNGLESCTVKAVKAQINRCFKGVDEFHTTMKKLDKDASNLLAWPAQATFTARRLSKPTEPLGNQSIHSFPSDNLNPFFPGNVSEYDGMTEDDRAYTGGNSAL